MKSKEILDHFVDVHCNHGKANSYIAQCPVCGKADHLYIKLKDGKTLVYCQSCQATYRDILDAAGLNDNKMSEKGKNAVDRSHVYYNSDGTIFGRKDILHDSDGKKFGLWQLYDGHKYVNGLNGHTAPLYNLPELVASEGKTIYIAEGEKDADTIGKMGYTATTLPNGANQRKWQESYTTVLSGRRIIVVTDNDESGDKYGSFIADNIADSASSFKIVPANTIMASLKHKGDISDIVDDIGLPAAKAALDGAVAKAAKIQKEDESSNRSKTISISALQKWLDDRNIRIRYNVIAHTISIDGMSPKYNPETILSDLHLIVFDNIKETYQCTPGLIADMLNVIAHNNRYNPVIDMLAFAPEWDGKDRIAELYQILHIDQNDELSCLLIRKWLWQCIAMAHNDVNDAFGADGVLTIQGPQGIGKTSLVAKLGMDNQLFKLGQHIDSFDKDTIRRCSSCWICEWGEVETTLKSDLERLKAFITTAIDEYRLPYGRADVVLARRTSIIATCNSDRFLIDPTGSRRFWTVKVDSIDLEALDQFDSIQLWKQVEQLYSIDHQGFRLSREEQKELAQRNTAHEKPLKAQCEVEDIIHMAKEDSLSYRWGNITVTDFKSRNPCLSHYTVEQIGKALTKIGITSDRTSVDGKVIRTRYLPYRYYD